MDTQLELRQEERPVKKLLKWRPGKRSIAIACAVVVIATAVVLNIVLFAGKGDATLPSTPSGGEEDEGNTVVDSADGYFSATQVSRQRARDEALEVLQSVVESESADEATKTEALGEIADLAKAMEAEANIETLILAKGFERCVAVINGDTCSVVVSGSELQPAQISQINEIVYEQTGIKPANVRIVTK